MIIRNTSKNFQLTLCHENQDSFRMGTKFFANFQSGVYKVEHSPHWWWGGEIKSKGLEMGKKMKSLEKRKKKIFEDIMHFVVPKGKICLLQHNSTLS